MSGAVGFDVSGVRAALVDTRFGEVSWVAQTASTNADLLDLAVDAGAEGVVLGADHQTAGRGRRGRTWSAPPEAAVLVSVLLRPPAPAVELVTPAVAVAAAEAVEATCGAAPGIKWPNDLVVTSDDGGPDRKLAGILAEVVWPPGADVASGWRAPGPAVRVPVVVGMGLNVTAAGRSPDLDPVAIACDEVTSGDRHVGREELVVAWLQRLDRWYGCAVDPARNEELWAAWRSRSATLGRRVRVDLGPDEVVGQAVDVTATGQLVLLTDEGARRALAVGDVTHLRAE